MKKNAFVILMVLFGAALFAQPQQQPEPVSISGTLVLSEGRIALQSGKDMYYLAGLNRLVGFIDGFKENAQVKLDGYDRAFEYGGTSRHVFHATKLYIGNKSWDLGGPALAGTPQFRQPAPGNFQKDGRRQREFSGPSCRDFGRRQERRRYN